MTGRTIGGRYRLLARRGTGATSAVFTGVDVRDDTPVAVKLLHPSLAHDAAFVQRFEAAMAQATGFTHPNLVRVLGFGTETAGQRRYLYVASEQVAGGSLQDIVDRGRLLSPAQALTVGLGVCRGLDAMHRAGLVHRDIRPGSVLFTIDREPKIVDVGLSGLLADLAWAEPSAVELDRARFASPEQAQVGQPGAAVVGSPTDVYSLALTLVAAITGRVPFVGDSTTATLGNRVGKLLPVSADYGPLASPLERAARPDPAERSTAAEFGRGLTRAAANLDRPAPIPIVASAVAFGEPAPTTAQARLEPTRVDHAPVDPTGGAARPVPAIAGGTGAVPVVPRDPSGTLARPTLYDEDAPAPTARSRRRAWWAIAAALVVVAVAVGALLATRAMRTTSYPVPDLAGLTTGEAQNQIAGNGWEVSIEHETSDDQPADHVIRTEPAVGVDLQEGDPFTLVVSDGPPPSPLPDLTAATVDQATALVEAAGLTPSVQPAQYDENVPEGTVLQWDVPAQPMLAAGDLVQKGTEVRIVPSGGPAPRVMPDMVNVDLARSQQALADRQLSANVTEDFSPTVPAGTVISQSIPPKTEVPRGTVVDLVVSKGPDVVVFPELAGLDYNGVVTTLTNAGFVAGAAPAITAGDTSQPLQQALIEGAPAVVGTSYPRGTAVNLVYPETPPAPPDSTADTTPAG